MAERCLAVNIPIRCLGCSRLRTKQIDMFNGTVYCKDAVIPGESCQRNTNFTD